MIVGGNSFKAAMLVALMIMQSMSSTSPTYGSWYLLVECRWCWCLPATLFTTPPCVPSVFDPIDVEDGFRWQTVPETTTGVCGRIFLYPLQTGLTECAGISW